MISFAWYAPDIYKHDFCEKASFKCDGVIFVHSSQNSKLGHSCVRGTKGRLYESRVRYHVIVHLGLNVSSSAHNCGCVVNGGNAMAAI